MLCVRFSLRKKSFFFYMPVCDKQPPAYYGISMKHYMSHLFFFQTQCNVFALAWIQHLRRSVPNSQRGRCCQKHSSMIYCPRDLLMPFNLQPLWQHADAALSGASWLCSNVILWPCCTIKTHLYSICKSFFFPLRLTRHKTSGTNYLQI